MVIIQVSGGLGNQLRAFAIYVKFKTLGVKAKLDVSLYDSTKEFRGGGYIDRDLELDFLDLNYDKATKKEIQFFKQPSIYNQLVNRIRFGRTKLVYSYGKYDLSVFDIREGYIAGDFSQEGYTLDVEDQLRKEIQFPQSNNKKNKEIIEKIKNTNSISIHVRRGDFLDSRNYGSLGSVTTDQYYMSAIDYIKSHINENVTFFLFSDDKEYIKEHFLDIGQVEIVDWNKGKGSFYDMYLMSLCKHNITAYSSFSIWASRLNSNPDKIVTRVVPEVIEDGCIGNCVFFDSKGNMLRDRK